MGVSDIRLEGLREKLGSVKSITIIASPKGGVGKTTITYAFASILSQRHRIGVWDMDLTGPSLHVLFDVKNTFSEEMGINPPQVHKNILFMSITLFSGDRPLPLRGREMTEVFLELAAVTNWGDLDHLLVDTPPTISDTFLDIMHHIPNAEFVVVTTESMLSYQSVIKIAEIIRENKRKAKALIINQMLEQTHLREKDELRERLFAYFERRIFFPYIRDIERYRGRVDELAESPQIAFVRKEVEDMFSQ